MWTTRARPVRQCQELLRRAVGRPPRYLLHTTSRRRQRHLRRKAGLPLRPSARATRQTGGGARTERRTAAASATTTAAAAAPPATICSLWPQRRLPPSAGRPRPLRPSARATRQTGGGARTGPMTAAASATTTAAAAAPPATTSSSMRPQRHLPPSAGRPLPPPHNAGAPPRLGAVANAIPPTPTATATSTADRRRYDGHNVSSTLSRLLFFAGDRADHLLIF